MKKFFYLLIFLLLVSSSFGGVKLFIEDEKTYPPQNIQDLRINFRKYLFKTFEIQGRIFSLKSDLKLLADESDSILIYKIENFNFKEEQKVSLKVRLLKVNNILYLEFKEGKILEPKVVELEGELTQIGNEPFSEYVLKDNKNIYLLKGYLTPLLLLHSGSKVKIKGTLTKGGILTKSALEVVDYKFSEK
ncbi:MAG: hypothetical protein HYU63_06485 [Armatimonadetes bacterium]|nr:hypothetical protein [Armatimonadota bacterium]